GAIFAQSESARNIIENRPILFPRDEFSLTLIWDSFTTSFFLSLIALGILIYVSIKRGDTDKILFIIWSSVLLVFTLAMRRFADFLAINLALLTGYLSWVILEFVSLRKVSTKPVETQGKVKKKAKKRARQKVGFLFTNRRVSIVMGPIVIFFLVFFPNIGPIVSLQGMAYLAPDEAWYESLSWMKDNTSDPFDDPDFYYDLYDTPFHYPETAYGVISFWDYGYWISRIAQRPTICDPGGGYRGDVSRFFLAQDETSANKIIDKLNARFIIIDIRTIIGYIQAITTRTNSSVEDFYDIYYSLEEDRLVPFKLFHPEFYRSLVVRLYAFDGREVVPESCNVISYETKLDQQGTPYKMVTDVFSFDTYEEAQTYMSIQKSDNYKIFNGNPYITPVPLRALENYKLVHGSQSSIELSVGNISEVKIFEYVK
ncbi:hypothetical protein ACFLWG_00660, partial [Chloroflexota bacterium]